MNGIFVLWVNSSYFNFSASYMHQASLETICLKKPFQLHYCPHNDAKSMVKRFIFLHKFTVIWNAWLIIADEANDWKRNADHKKRIIQHIRSSKSHWALPQCGEMTTFVKHLLRSHQRFAHGQRHPMHCLELLAEEVEWEQGSGPKGPMSCRTQGWSSIYPEMAYLG